MPLCLLGCLGLAFPRIALLFMWLVKYTATAFETRLWPVLGFFFMPYTTCAYALAVNEVGALKGWGLVLIVLGVLLDLGGHGSGAGYRYYRREKIVREHD